MNNPDEFEQTGNQVPIRIDELIACVHERLEQYDKLTEATQATPSYSPYLHPIIYTTNEGKTIQIPPDVQKKAIDQWKEVKKQQTQQNSQELQQMQNMQEMMGLGQGLGQQQSCNLPTSLGGQSLGQDPDHGNAQYAPFGSNQQSDQPDQLNQPGQLNQLNQPNQSFDQYDAPIQELPVGELPMSEEEPPSYNTHRYNPPTRPNRPMSVQDTFINTPNSYKQNDSQDKQMIVVKENNDSSMMYFVIIIFTLGALYYLHKNNKLNF